MLYRFIDSILNLPPEVLSTWGYAIIAVATLVDSIPFLGMAIPGGILVIAAGFFVKVGTLSLIPALSVVIIAALVGDMTGYILGRKFGYNFLIRFGKYIFFKPIHFEKTKKVLHAHPAKSIILGRFHSLTRCIVPFAAGSTGMRAGVFIPFSTLGIVLWSLFSVFLGYIFGQGFEVASRYVGVVFFAALVVSVVVVYSFRFISVFTTKNKHIFDRYQIYPLALNLIATYVFARLTEATLMSARIHRIDLYVGKAIHTLVTPALTKFFVALTYLASPTNFIIVAVLISLYVIYRHRWYFLILLPTALTSGLISQVLFNRSIKVARPAEALINVSGFSFPSGHAALATIFFILIAYFFKEQIASNATRKIFYGACTTLALLVCFSRLYLSVHWLSDVIAGIALGVFWVTLFIILFHFFRSLSRNRFQEELDTELSQ